MEEEEAERPHHEIQKRSSRNTLETTSFFPDSAAEACFRVRVVIQGPGGVQEGLSAVVLVFRQQD